MAQFELAIPKTLQWEGGWVNDPDDPGGATNRGIIFTLFKKYAHKLALMPTVEALKNLTEDQAKIIYKDFFWERMWGDSIQSQPLANLLFDTMVNLDELKLARGNVHCRSIELLQVKAGCKADGIMGPNTLGVINMGNSKILFEGLKEARIKYYNDLADRKPVMQKFLNGWLRRVNDFNYE